jgi:hypothetical protein
VTHGEGDAGHVVLAREQRALIGAEQAQVVGAPALHEAQVTGVINNAGKLWLANIATQRLDSIGALEGYSVNKRRFSTLLP